MSDQLFSVKDRVTLVSGGSRGIGKALAAAFAERGAKVVITGREKETLEKSAAEISPEGNPVVPLVCDVSAVESLPNLTKTIVDQFGSIDILLNVAGVNKRQRVEQFTPEEYDFILDINLRGAFFLAQEVGKQMLKQGSGAQVHIDSLNTYAPLKGVLPYAMSKAGISMMTRGMATEWGPRGVRVNALAPGFILTAMTSKLWSIPTMQEWGKRNSPLGRLGEVSDLVGAAVFLSSDASAFMTGQVIYVDGGMTAGINWPIELD
ncbi:MAG: glucose 1-dehydrogenase [Planctomycetota bacterium]|nr:glucose 1-dehydrogenase [Planctomycetota bacterium]MDA1212256.1 glucose 1-dehydrogenase [Planctomycetota bacterium]